MRIAIPVAKGVVAGFEEACDQFSIVDVDPNEALIEGSFGTGPVPETCEDLISWVQSRGADLVIARSASQEAQGWLAERGIRLIVVTERDAPHTLVRRFLARDLGSA